MASGLPPLQGDTFRLAIEERSDPGRVIGVVGVFFSEPPECGYMFRTETWGRGYGTEALRAWLNIYWALPRKEVMLEDKDGGNEATEPEYLLAKTAPANIGSRKVLAKCGFTELQIRVGDGDQLVQYIHQPSL